MLKIKDNVDLKELEQYGFIKEKVKTPIGDIECYSFKVSGVVRCVRIDNRRSVIKINPYTKQIIIEKSLDESIVDVLFNLIQAGLVEKVKNE